MKKLKQIKKLLEVLNSEEDIINKVKSLGFDSVVTRNPNELTIYIHYKKRIVVKFPNIRSGYDVPKWACPTEIIKTKDHGHCFIQPLINDSEDDIMNHKNFEEFEIKVCEDLCDMHVGNFGIYRGNLIIHDW